MVYGREVSCGSASKVLITFNFPLILPTDSRKVVSVEPPNIQKQNTGAAVKIYAEFTCRF
jgi:hypothetical protein